MSIGSSERRARASAPIVALGVAWFLAVAVGFLALWIYKTRPGAEGGAVPRQWPAASRIHPSAGRPTLLFFAHPRCACTRASISELARLMSRFQDRLDARGGEARRFGVETSGAVILYDSAGKLAFHGGITPARGHEGDSFGRQRIAALLEGAPADRADAPVFGCTLDESRPAQLAQADHK